MTGEGMNHDADPGEKMAGRIATGIASLVAISIVAAGGAIYSNSLAIARLAEKCESKSQQLDELHGRLAQYPSAGDIARCGTRIETIEQYLKLDEHRMNRLEESVRDLERKPAARADPFTGTDGRELERRIKALESKP